MLAKSKVVSSSFRYCERLLFSEPSLAFAVYFLKNFCGLIIFMVSLFFQEYADFLLQIETFRDYHK